MTGVCLESCHQPTRINLVSSYKSTWKCPNFNKIINHQQSLQLHGSTISIWNYWRTWALPIFRTTSSLFRHNTTFMSIAKHISQNAWSIIAGKILILFRYQWISFLRCCTWLTKLLLHWTLILKNQDFTLKVPSVSLYGLWALVNLIYFLPIKTLVSFYFSVAPPLQCCWMCV